MRYPRRPPRLRTIFPGVHPLYFITFTTSHRRVILAGPVIHEAFVEFCRKAPDRGFVVGRYVIMPDHIHLFVGVAPTSDLSRWMQAVKSILGKKLSARGFEKPHWQEGFFDHLMRSGESYEQKWEYVRLNPVRKGLCADPDEWPFQGEIETLRW